MWPKVRTLILILSVSLNLAVFTAWLVHSKTVWYDRPLVSIESDTRSLIWCPLYRQLGVSQEQWARIEPHLIEFRAKAEGLRREMKELRLNFIGLIAAPVVDHEAVAAEQEKIRDAQARMQALVTERLLAEKEMLGPDQQKRLFDMIRTRCLCSDNILLSGSWTDGKMPGENE
jgi:Spy/CpxP family protein refolding chaperone